MDSILKELEKYECKKEQAFELIEQLFTQTEINGKVMIIETIDPNSIKAYQRVNKKITTAEKLPYCLRADLVFKNNIDLKDFRNKLSNSITSFSQIFSYQNNNISYPTGESVNCFFVLKPHISNEGIKHQLEELKLALACYTPLQYQWKLFRNRIVNYNDELISNETRIMITEAATLIKMAEDKMEAIESKQKQKEEELNEAYQNALALFTDTDEINYANMLQLNMGGNFIQIMDGFILNNFSNYGEIEYFTESNYISNCLRYLELNNYTTMQQLIIGIYNERRMLKFFNEYLTNQAEIGYRIKPSFGNMHRFMSVIRYAMFSIIKTQDNTKIKELAETMMDKEFRTPEYIEEVINDYTTSYKKAIKLNERFKNRI
jgi:hypothetical protein